MQSRVSPIREQPHIVPPHDVGAANTALEETSVILKALAHPMRLAVVRALSAGERSVTDLQVGLGFSQPALSQQLAVLRGARVVTTKKRAKNVYYCLARERTAIAFNLLSDLKA